MAFLPTPVQTPASPSGWAGGGRTKHPCVARRGGTASSLKRGPDGLPTLFDPAEIGEIARYIAAQRTVTGPFDLVCARPDDGDGPPGRRGPGDALRRGWRHLVDGNLRSGSDPLAEAQRRIGAGPPAP